MRKVRGIEDVLRKGLCISCGACVSSSPDGSMRMTLDAEKGIYVPEIRDSAKVSGRGVEFIPCPAKGVPLEQLSCECFGADLPFTPELGRYRIAVAAYSLNPELLKNAASGGVMIDIAAYLLERGHIGGATGVRFEYTEQGPRTRPYVARTVGELMAAQGSKYCPTSTNVLVRQCLREGGRYLFVGTPCQVAALRLAARQDPDLGKVFPYTMGNFCGGYRDFRELDAIIRRNGMDPSEVVCFRHRGGGWPGSLFIRARDGRSAEEPYPDYAKKPLYLKQRRCSLCIDGTALLADFACGDAWLDRFLNNGHGWSILVARSAFAQRTVDDMVVAGRIRTSPVTFEEVLYSQRFNLDSKIQRQRMRRAVFRLMGHALPEYDVRLPRGNATFLQEMKIYLAKTRLGAKLRRMLGKG